MPVNSKESKKKLSETQSKDIEEALQASVGDVVDDSNISKIAHAVIGVTSKASYRGPLPTAAEFSKYEAASPGAGKKILKYMETEQAHRKSMDNILVTASVEDTKRGQRHAFVVMILLISCAFVAGFFDKVWLSAIFMGAVAIGTVSKFIDGRREDKNS